MIINKKLLGKISNSYVIEKGGTDNTNFYAKYSDGTLIQWGVSTFNDKITIANGNGLYRSENQITKTLAIPFLNTNYYPILTGLGGNLALACISDRTTTSFKFYPNATWSVNNNNWKSVFFIIIGVWK